MELSVLKLSGGISTWHADVIAKVNICNYTHYCAYINGVEKEGEWNGNAYNALCNSVDKNAFWHQRFARVHCEKERAWFSHADFAKCFKGIFVDKKTVKE